MADTSLTGVSAASLGLNDGEVRQLDVADQQGDRDGIATKVEYDHFRAASMRLPNQVLPTEEWVSGRLAVLEAAGNLGVSLREGAQVRHADRLVPGQSTRLTGVIRETPRNIGIPDPATPRFFLMLDVPVVVGNLARDPLFAVVYLPDEAQGKVGERVTVSGTPDIFFLFSETNRSRGPFLRLVSVGAVPSTPAAQNYARSLIDGYDGIKQQLTEKSFWGEAATLLYGGYNSVRDRALNRVFYEPGSTGAELQTLAQASLPFFRALKANWEELKQVQGLPRSSPIEIEKASLDAFLRGGAALEARIKQIEKRSPLLRPVHTEGWVHEQAELKLLTALRGGAPGLSTLRAEAEKMLARADLDSTQLQLWRLTQAAVSSLRTAYEIASAKLPEPLEHSSSTGA